MADSFDSSTGGGIAPDSQRQDLPPDYESPVFDLHPETDADRFNPIAPVPGSRVVVGEETIPIAPHPTTNRFPWAPVDNPTVPVYGTVPNSPPPPPPPPVAQPLPEYVPAPVQTPVQRPAPPTIATPPPVYVPPVVAPAPLPVPPPLAPVLPVIEPRPEPELSPIAEVRLPSQPAPQAPMIQPAHQSSQHGSRIYSAETRTAWRVFRPGKVLKLLYFVIFFGLGITIYYIWQSTGATLNPRDLPFMDRLLTQ